MNPNGTVLGNQARALAEHVAAFNDLVARDTDTHDGEPRGDEWVETCVLPGDVMGFQILDNWERLLCDLADVWDDG